MYPGASHNPSSRVSSALLTPSSRPPGAECGPQGETRALVLAPPPAGDLCARSPRAAPPPPSASQRPFVSLSPRTLVPEKFQEKNRRETKTASAAKWAGSVGQGQGCATARGVPSKTPRPRRARGLPRNHKSPRLLPSGRGGFSKSRGVRRQAQTGGSPGGGTGSRAAAGGKSGGPRDSLPTAPD